MKTVLLVDPDCDDRIGLERVLQRSGYQVLPEEKGRSALNWLTRETAIAAVITECHLTDMDGLDFLLELRRRLPKVPIIVHSANQSIETYLKCINLGVYEYACKPVRPREWKRLMTAVFAATGEPPAQDAPRDGQDRRTTTR